MDTKGTDRSWVRLGCGARDSANVSRVGTVGLRRQESLAELSRGSMLTQLKEYVDAKHLNFDLEQAPWVSMLIPIQLTERAIPIVFCQCHARSFDRGDFLAELGLTCWGLGTRCDGCAHRLNRSGALGGERGRAGKRRQSACQW
jgi:hypothetical protein